MTQGSQPGTKQAESDKYAELRGQLAWSQQIDHHASTLALGKDMLNALDELDQLKAQLESARGILRRIGAWQDDGTLHSSMTISQIQADARAFLEKG